MVDAVSFGESTKSFPQIKASLTVHAFVYGDLSMVVPPVAETAPTTTDTTSTTTEPTTTAESPDTPPEGATAAPETP